MILCPQGNPTTWVLTVQSIWNTVLPVDLHQAHWAQALSSAGQEDVSVGSIEIEIYRAAEGCPPSSSSSRSQLN